MKDKNQENKNIYDLNELSQEIKMTTLSSFNDSKTCPFVKCTKENPNDPTKSVSRVAPIPSSEATALIREDNKSQGKPPLSPRAVANIKDAMASEAYDHPSEEVFGRYFMKDGFPHISTDRFGEKILRIEPGAVKFTNASNLGINTYMTPNHLDMPRPTKIIQADIVRILEEFSKAFRLTKSQGALCLTFILSVLKTDTPKVQLVIIGPEGSGKTALSKFISSLLNPSQNGINAISGKRDIVAYAKTTPLLGFDNVSKLPPSLQDLLCIINTGGSVSERKLHSNHELVYVQLQASIIMTAISVDLRPDLAERSILIDLTNAQGPRLSASVLEKKLDALKPRLFSALVYLLPQVMTELPSIKIEDPTRMGDFEALGTAIGKVLGYQKSFSAMYQANLRKSAQNAVDSEPAILLVMQIVKMSSNVFQGTYGALLNQVRTINYSKEPLPSSEKAFSEVLRRHERSMNKLGYIITRLGRTNLGQLVRITF